MAEELFQFTDDDPREAAPSAVAPWTVLSVEDDPSYQRALAYSLRNLVIEGRPVRLLTAASSLEASQVLATHPDTALILLDVVMETDDAGLRFIETVRNTLCNRMVRIVLLTGQPGTAPREDVVREYDINEYWDKTELHDRLPSVVTTNLRAWQTMKELEQAQAGLQMVVDAARGLSSRFDVEHFAQTVLNQISRLLHVSSATGGIVCSVASGAASGRVIAATGRFEPLNGGDPKQLLDAALLEMFKKAVTSRAHVFEGALTALYFESSENGPPKAGASFVVLVSASGPLSQSHIRLLEVFAENVGSGFVKVRLQNRMRELAYLDQDTQMFNRNWLRREISLMSSEERAAASVILFRIEDYYLRYMAFGPDFANQLIHELMAELHAIAPASRMHVRFSPEVLACVCDRRCVPSEGDLARMTEWDLEGDGIRNVTFVSVAYLHLADFPELDADDILSAAKAAVLEAPTATVPVLHYQPERMERTKRDLALANQIVKAISAKEFFIVLQPKVDLENGRPVGFEALVRWRRPGGEFVSPAAFIPVAENSGVIQRLDAYVLEEVIRAQKKLGSAGWALPISFNATVKDLEQKHYLALLDAVVSDPEVEAGLLEMEITESGLMREYESKEALLRRLRDSGMKIAIDDFGTGYSSLAHLARIPATTLKIDQSFVRGMGSETIDGHIVEMVIRLAQRMEVELVAEGVETEEQASALRRLGCRIGQGFLYARPMPLDALLDWLQESRAA